MASKRPVLRFSSRPAWNWASIDSRVAVSCERSSFALPVRVQFYFGFVGMKPRVNQCRLTSRCSSQRRLSRRLLWLHTELQLRRQPARQAPLLLTGGPLYGAEGSSANQFGFWYHCEAMSL